MQAAVLAIRSFRNLTDTEVPLPPEGVALVGPNGHGKTNFLEAIGYPVLFRSLRGALDRELACFNGPGFHVSLRRNDGLSISTTWEAAGARKRILINEVEVSLSQALGHWLAVSFLPSDLTLISGGAAERRRWLDRLLSLSQPGYLSGLLRFRRILAQRNAALRQHDGRTAELFNSQLAHEGVGLIAGRLAWFADSEAGFVRELAGLGEKDRIAVTLRCNRDLTTVAGWTEVLLKDRSRDLARGQTHSGPHRDDLLLSLGGRLLRDYGSTGQQRSAAIALRLVELETLARARQTRPALLVDDVFAALDGERQERLALRLMAHPGQRFVTAPGLEEIPVALGLPRWQVTHGQLKAER